MPPPSFPGVRGILFRMNDLYEGTDENGVDIGGIAAGRQTNRLAVPATSLRVACDTWIEDEAPVPLAKRMVRCHIPGLGEQD